VAIYRPVAIDGEEQLPAAWAARVQSEDLNVNDQNRPAADSGGRPSRKYRAMLT
jgi:hypothetical protein